MNKLVTAVYSLGIGAALMYLYDPDAGNRRRALLRDQVDRAFNSLDDALDTALEDARNRARGLAAEMSSIFRGGEAPDVVLEARARAELGRVARFPRAIDVMAQDGFLTLRGPVLADEADRVVTAMGRVRGVRGVENQLQPHASAEGVSALQGNPPPREPRMELLQENWSPATRLLASAGGGLLGLYGMRHGGATGLLLSAIGMGTALRGLTNVPPRRLLGSGADNGREAVTVQKAINIEASPEEVYELWSNFENFPRFMAHVREVRSLGQDRSHWKVAGPAGTTAEWDAVVTRRVPARLLAWKSIEGQPVHTAGMVRFDPNPGGGTRVTVRLGYTPPAGALGHVVASLLGVDPKQAMDEDLARLKSLIETGRTTAEGQQVRREEVSKGTT